LILFYQKEAVRKACQRDIDHKNQQRSALNIIRITTPIQFVLSLLVFLVVGLWQTEPLSDEPNFTLAIFLQCLAAFIENLAEPYYYTMLWKGDLQGKVKTELIALTVKSLLTYWLLTQDFKLLAYSISQLVYSVILVLTYPRLVKIEMPLSTVAIEEEES
jgi:hypothetical protein